MNQVIEIQVEIFFFFCVCANKIVRNMYEFKEYIQGLGPSNGLKTSTLMNIINNSTFLWYEIQ